LREAGALQREWLKKAFFGSGAILYLNSQKSNLYMHTADGGYAAAHPSCTNKPARHEMPASVHAETSIISQLASSIFVPDCFLLVRASRAVVTRDTCCPPTRPASREHDLLVSTAMLCSSTSSTLSIFICACVLLFPLANFHAPRKRLLAQGSCIRRTSTLMQVRIMLACGFSRGARLFCDYSSMV